MSDEQSRAQAQRVTEQNQQPAGPQGGVAQTPQQRLVQHKIHRRLQRKNSSSQGDSKKLELPVWVEFSADGKWDGPRVLAALQGQRAVAAELQEAILAGPTATARRCVALRERAVKAAVVDPSKQAHCDTVANALTRRVNELVNASPSSPLEYQQLLEVVRWWDELTAQPVVPPAGSKEPIEEHQPEQATETGKEAETGGHVPTAGERYRAEMARRLERFNEKNSVSQEGGSANEGKDTFFDSYMPIGSLEGSRKATGQADKPFTTCNTFAGIISGAAAAAVDVKTISRMEVADDQQPLTEGTQVVTKVDKATEDGKRRAVMGTVGKVSKPHDGGFKVGIDKVGFLVYARDEIARFTKVPVVGPELMNPKQAAKMPPGAWTLATPGLTARPQVGDTLVFGKGETFNHVALFKESYRRPATATGAKTDDTGAKTDDTEEVWVTINGGFGTAGRYGDSEENKAKGKHGGGEQITQGKEAVQRLDQVYLPATNQLVQTKYYSAKLHGWVNIEKMAQPDAPAGESKK